MTTLQFSCACGQVGGSIQIPTTAIPLPLGLCHCNTCRHQTGLLAGSYAYLPKDHKNFERHGNTATYAASERLFRHFCGTCGTNVFLVDKEINEVSPSFLCSGAITTDGNEPRMNEQIFIKDTKDGGMSPWFPSIQGWEGFSDSKPVDCSRQLPESSRADVTSKNPELPCYCQCRKIQFRITKPNEKSRDLHGPFADLLAPYVSTSPEVIENPDDIKWWLRRQGTKYLAGTCACNSCRTNSGFDIQNWTFIPNVNLLDLNGSQLDIGTMQGLTKYGSSKGTNRYFCSQCGATVFYRREERPDLLDVSVGLLDAEEGARAESWLMWWTDRVSFDEDALNKTFIGTLKEGLRKWGEQAVKQRQ